MSRELLLQNMYALYSQMITANGFEFDWGYNETWENGTSIKVDTPKFTVSFGYEDNDDRQNGLGNNEYQNRLPVEVRFGKTMTAPSDSKSAVDSMREELLAKMIRDIKRAFGNPYKITMPDFYCGVEYSGEINMNEDNMHLDPYTVIGGLEFVVTYRESRGIDEW